MRRKLAATFRIFLRYNGLYAKELHQAKKSIFLVLYSVNRPTLLYIRYEL